MLSFNGNYLKLEHNSDPRSHFSSPVFLRPLLPKKLPLGLRVAVGAENPQKLSPFLGGRQHSQNTASASPLASGAETRTQVYFAITHKEVDIAVQTVDLAVQT